MGDINLDESWANSSINDGYQYSAPVGSYPAGASPYNAYDMAGNLWEWVADWYDENYYATSPHENPQGATYGEKRVLRGGSWYNGLKYMQPGARLSYQPEGRSLDFGFRCAQELS
jgi:formylglycine-generating enzyme required for sulfatase activity